MIGTASSLNFELCWMWTKDVGLINGSFRLRGNVRRSPVNIQEPVRRAILAAMLPSIQYRGPDDEGLNREQGLSLGMQRLSAMDLHGGHQPALNEDGSTCMVLNREIYDFRELWR